MTNCNQLTPLAFNRFTPELPQHGVPRPGAPRHNIICNVFSRNISKPIFCLYRNKKKDPQVGISALWEFVTVGEAGFSALRDERVKGLFMLLASEQSG